MTDSNDVPCQLSHLRLLSDFSGDEIEALVSLSDDLRYAAGEAIVRQDELGDRMYLLLEGEAIVRHHKDGETFDLACLRSGDFFGELALVDEGPRSADVVAKTDCRLLALSQGVIRALAGVYPGAAFKLLLSVGRVLVERMRAGNQKYIDSLLVNR